MLLGSIAAVDGPPPDADGRVTNPQRFAVLHAAARQLIDELDVSIPASGPANGPGGRPLDITTLCPSDDGAFRQIALTDFPGVDVRFGAWISAAFPRCGCDACDEQPAEVAVELREFVDALIGGTDVEWWDGRRAGHRHQTSEEQTELMASYADVENFEPDLADRVRAILSSTTNAVVGTIRHDGSPRLSGVDPFFHNGQLRIWSMPRARKGQDLRRDPRVALHSIPWDSRRLRDGATDVGAADAKVIGTATVTTDPGELSAFRAWLKSERGFEPPEDWDLFTIDVDALTVISADGGQLVIDRWSTTDGRQTIRRS